MTDRTARAATNRPATAATAAADPLESTQPRYRIGEIATAAGVSTRTLRYYEELGLVSPAGYSPGGARRYSDRDLGRVRRIRELQHLVGFNLDEIKTIVAAEARLGELRTEYRAGRPPERECELRAEAIEINNRLREDMRAKLARLETFLADLDARAALYRRRPKDTKAVPKARAKTAKQ
ncbi:MAG: MerR family transcriptional regulator [Acidimicrobiia bacterium]|nr:MerR family transcriptional regulator [Acidimicrobiia bacterium]